MPGEPDKKLNADELLRAYARERRKDADAPIHPATRRLLQGEVARVYGRGSAGMTWWRRFRRFWPQIALASSLGVVLLISVFSLRERPERTVVDSASAPRAELFSTAKKESPAQGIADDFEQGEMKARGEQSARLEDRTASTVQQDEIALEQTAPVLADPATSLERSVTQTPPRMMNGDAGTQQRPIEPAESEPEFMRTISARSEAPAKALSRDDQSSAAVSAAGVASVPPPKAVVEKLARGTELTNLGAALRLRFVELPDRAKREAKAPILTSFQLEQAGEDLRIFENDGSIYAGQLFSPTELDRQTLELAPILSGSNASPVLTELSRNTAVYFFHAQGTNRTLAKPVTLHGRYFERTNEVPSAETTFSFSTNDAPNSARSAASVIRPRRAILAKAKIGDTNEVPVTAVSVEP